MIEPLTPDAVAHSCAQLSMALPAQVLQLIARVTLNTMPLTMASLSGQVRRFLPTFDSKLFHECLSWLERHGDIERGRAGRLTCPPPYLVLGSESHGQRQGLLLGSPLYDDSILSEFPNASYKAEVIQDAGHAVGWERRLTFPGGAQLPAEISWLLRWDLSEFQQVLPSLRQIYIPPEPAVVATWGHWERYLPGGKWQPAPETQAQENQLWRWRPSAEDHPRQARHFAIASGQRSSRFRELFSLQAALLWCLYLDQQAGEAQRVYRKGAALYVPRALPTSVERWLLWEQRLGASQTDAPTEHWSSTYWRYILSSAERAADAQRFLEERLGLRPKLGVPA